MVSRRTIISTAAVTGAAAGAGALWWRGPGTPDASAAPSTCELALVNNTDSSEVNAYVTGLEWETDKVIMITKDGPYYIEDTSEPETPLPVDAAIPLGGPGEEVVVTLPRMHGSRIYFVREDTIDFYVNPGPALAEPALHNDEDSNYEKIISFCEFTFNDVQLFVNISYVDLVTALPIGLRLQGVDDRTVEPLPEGAVEDIAADLEAQAAEDGQPWDQLVLKGSDGNILRVMSPQNLMATQLDDPDMPFADYWSSYADEVWEQYQDTDIVVDLQGGRGTMTGRIEGDELVFDDGSSFSKPDSWDIFTCDHGPFTNDPSDSEEKKGALARLAAAFNRSTIHAHSEQPNGAPVEEFYDHEVTNHYSKAVHANSPIGYAFPYDDVTPDDAPDQSGAAWDGEPERLTVTVN